jgi:hypothetical protein
MPPLTGSAQFGIFAEEFCGLCHMEALKGINPARNIKNLATEKGAGLAVGAVRQIREVRLAGIADVLFSRAVHRTAAL